jgi:hypothetical protein
VQENALSLFARFLMFELPRDLGEELVQGFGRSDSTLQHASIAQHGYIVRRILETQAVGGTLRA